MIALWVCTCFVLGTVSIILYQYILVDTFKRAFWLSMTSNLALPTLLRCLEQYWLGQRQWVSNAK